MDRGSRTGESGTGTGRGWGGRGTTAGRAVWALVGLAGRGGETLGRGAGLRCGSRVTGSGTGGTVRTVTVGRGSRGITGACGVARPGTAAAETGTGRVGTLFVAVAGRGTGCGAPLTCGSGGAGSAGLLWGAGVAAGLGRRVGITGRGVGAPVTGGGGRGAGGEVCSAGRLDPEAARRPTGATGGGLAGKRSTNWRRAETLRVSVGQDAQSVSIAAVCRRLSS